jgi:hypothetical protein
MYENALCFEKVQKHFFSEKIQFNSNILSKFWKICSFVRNSFLKKSKNIFLGYFSNQSNMINKPVLRICFRILKNTLSRTFFFVYIFKKFFFREPSDNDYRQIRKDLDFNLLNLVLLYNLDKNKKKLSTHPNINNVCVWDKEQKTAITKRLNALINQLIHVNKWQPTVIHEEIVIISAYLEWTYIHINAL